MNRMILAIVTSLSLSCGTSSQVPESSVSSLGSWSTTVGGSLSHLTPSDISQFQNSRFFKVSMPVGLGIKHVFIGVEVERAGATELYTTGLVGDADGAYWAQHRWSAAHVKFIRFFDAADTQKVMRLLQRKFDGSVYHNNWIYSAAMLATPLTGRPCAKTANSVIALLENL